MSAAYLISDQGRQVIIKLEHYMLWSEDQTQPVVWPRYSELLTKVKTRICYAI